MAARDHFLLGADLRKDPVVITRAYNDARGVTAEFNRNALCVLNATVGSDFDPGAFAHRAVYEPAMHRIEMYLIPDREQRVVVPGLGQIVIAAGEPILTEVSYKYDRDTIERMLTDAGMTLVDWLVDPAQLFALVLARPRST
jgi:L-histidine N-alpha-methyltransferase